MKSLLPLASFAILLSGCTAPLEMVTQKIVQQPYKKVLVMYVEGSFNLYGLDSATYNTAMRGNFNNLDNLVFRKATESNFKDKLASGRTLIIGSSEFFDVNKDVTYTEFTEGLKSLGVEAILLVNRQPLGGTPAMLKSGQQVMVNDYGFRFYLIDLNGNKPVWLAQAPYYHTGQVGKNLIKAGYVSDPLSAKDNPQLNGIYLK